MKLYLGLAGPLLLWVYLPLALIGLAVVFGKLRNWKARAWVCPIYLILAYLIPLGDVTWHSWNMSKVCPTAGLHVYRTVVVEGFIPETVVSQDLLEKYGYRFVETRPRSDKNGTVLRFERVGAKIFQIANATPIAEWEIVRDRIDYPDKSLGVTVQRDLIRNRSTGEVIAEDATFSAWRGWIDTAVAALIDNSAGVCYRKPSLLDSFSEILIPAEVTSHQRDQRHLVF